MQQLTLEDAQTRLGDLMSAALKGETILIVGENQETVQLVPVPTVQRKPRVFGSGKGSLKMHEDFDEPLEDFREYME